MNYMKSKNTKNTNVKIVFPFFLFVVIFVFILSFVLPKFYNSPTVEPVAKVVEIEKPAEKAEIIEIEKSVETEVVETEINEPETEEKSILDRIFGNKKDE